MKHYSTVAPRVLVSGPQKEYQSKGLNDLVVKHTSTVAR